MDTDPKVVLLLPYLPHYRKEFIERLAPELKAKGYTLVCVVGQNRIKKEIHCVDDAGCEVIVLGSVQFRVLGGHIGIQRGLVPALRVLAPAKVVCLYNPGNLAHAWALLHCLCKRIPYILWGCSYELPEANLLTRLLRRSLRKFFLKKAVGHIGYGSERRDELVAMGIPKRQIWIAQNTVHVERIAAAGTAIDKAAARNSCGIPEGAIVALHVGALIARKKLEAMIDLLTRDDDLYQDMRFYIVGNGNDRPRLEALAAAKQIDHKVHFVGAKYGDELARYFRSADFFVMPGTGGLAVNEAMAYGLPVIAAHGDGTVVDLIEHRKTGYSLGSGPLEEDLASAVEWAISHDPDREASIRQRILAVAPLAGMVDAFSQAVCAAPAET